MHALRRTVALLAFLLLTSYFLLPVPALADETQQIPGEIGAQFGAAARGAGTGQQAGQRVEVVIARIITAALSIIGIIMVALLVYAGYLWMTAGGEEEKITKAKQIIRNAIIGIAIVLSAYAISLFVVNRLLSATQGTGSAPAASP